MSDAGPEIPDQGQKSINQHFDEDVAKNSFVFNSPTEAALMDLVDVLLNLSFKSGS